jgi:glycerol-3-phosphate acyltransferase PlsY
VGICLLAWALLVWLSGYVSLGSIVAAGLFPGAVWILYPERRPTIWIFVALAAVIIWMHRANIGRLVAGTENRFGRGDRTKGAA